jgi:hypothetical protein
LVILQVKGAIGVLIINVFKMVRSLHHPEKVIIELLGVVIVLFDIVLFRHLQLVVIVRGLHDFRKAVFVPKNVNLRTGRQRTQQYKKEE